MSGTVTAFPVAIMGYGRTLYFLTFYPNGSSAVSNASNKGVGWTVARTSQGLFTITMRDSMAQIDGAIPSPQLASVAARKLQIGIISVSAKTIQVRSIDDSAAVQDIAADANNSISMLVCVRHGAEL